MSQSAKRSADLAFEEDGDDVQAKKKRARRKARQKTQGQPIEVDLKSLPSELPADAKQDPPTAKLETRITRPESKKSKKSRHSKDGSEKRLSQIPKLETRITRPESRKLEKSRHSKDGSEKRLSEKGRRSKSLRKAVQTWNMSAASGGIFIEHDPILTADGKYLILLTRSHVRVYSTSTSLLVRSISVCEDDTLVGCSISASDSDTLLAATRSGVLVKIRLTDGKSLGQWRIGKGIKSIISISPGQSGDHYLVLKSTDSNDDELVVCSLETGGKLNSNVLFQGVRLQKFAVDSSNASTVVISSHRCLHVGSRDAGDGLAYDWHALPIQGLIGSFDIHVRIGSKQTKKVPSIDVAVGLENGAILVFDNVIANLASKAKGGQNADLSGRQLHWHRGCVRGVKWSRDGNYLISGGDETVLVIWRLETNQQQFLPHLSTSILNITISATGAHYALRLGDNSVMVLSTADLSPSTNVTGLSLPANRGERIPMLLHPLHSTRLLAAVPIRPSSKDSAQTATHLQTYDIDTSIQLNRQALTRNVTTAVNVSPLGQPIQEPDISHMQISPAGDWLATVDTWSPNSPDAQALCLDNEQAAKQKFAETVLRFWSWNASGASWDLTTRIDEPHAASKFCILGLASNPSVAEFATMGEDGWVKFWRPRRRVRDGVQVRNKSGDPLYTWGCVRSLQAEQSQADTSTRQPYGALTYSGDGSVLVASWSQPQRYVHVIDPRSGTLLMSLPHLLADGQASLAVMGRFLLCLSSSLRIFDLITLQVTFSMPIDHNGGSFLAANERSNSFVIGINAQERKKPAVLRMFDIVNVDQGSAHDFELPGRIHGVLAEPSGRGFVIVDSDGGTRKLSPPGGLSAASSATAKASDTFESEIEKGLEGIFGGGLAASAEGVNAGQQRLIEGGSGTSSSRNLADLFSVASTSAQLGVSELFNRVSKAISSAAVRA